MFLLLNDQFFFWYLQILRVAVVIVVGIIIGLIVSPTFREKVLSLKESQEDP